MPSARPHRDDVLIATAGLLSGLLLWLLNLLMLPGLAEQAPTGTVLIPLAVMSGLELLRRSAPLPALLLGLVVLAADLLTGALLATLVMFSDLVYAVAVYGSRRVSRLILPLASVLTVVVTVAAVYGLREPEALLLGASVAAVTVTPASTGVILRKYRDSAQAEQLRAQQTALLAEMDRIHAVAGERARMARELHDVVANHLSAIALHSSAALTLKDPDTTGRALAVIRENSTQGLAEMRQLIGLLRASDPGREADDELTASPTLDGLPELLARTRQNGAPRGLRITLLDRRPADRAALPAPVDLAAYRIVQEALTNAVKHAAPGDVRVILEQRDDALRFSVTSPLGETAGPAVPGSGSGLAGVRERVELLDGRVTAGPHPADGAGPPTEWRVRVVLPLR